MDDLYAAFMGLAPKRIPHWEHWSCPDAETYLTGIDYYDHPKLCRQKLSEIYPFLNLPIPQDDSPISRPTLGTDENSSHENEEGRKSIRWGAGESWHWDWGKTFNSADEALKFSPLQQGDFTDIPVVESRDYRDEEKLYQSYRAQYPAEWGDNAPSGGGSEQRGE